MSSYLERKLRWLLIGLVIIIILFTSYVYIFLSRNTIINHVNECRVLTSTSVNKIEKAYKNNSLELVKDEKYLYTVTDLRGNVIKTTDGDLQRIDLKTDLSFDGQYRNKNKSLVRYSTTLTVGDEVKGFIIFSIPIEEIYTLEGNKTISKWIPVIILVLTFIFIICKIYKTIQIDILKVIKELHISAKMILKGDYSSKVKYDYDGEVGEFSHDFEAMRDGLKVLRESEEKLKKAEKELIACISHDLKTPIATISGYCEGILDGVVKDEENIKRYASIILKKSKVLTKLIDDMLEYSKAEINEMTINREEVYSENYFLEVFEDVSMDVASSGKKFILEGSIENVLINIDRIRIAQVINNLISNAIKYTEKDGVIKVSVKNLESYVKVSIVDNGVGIVAEELPYVFNKFYRGEKHRNLDIPGSGLGLSISKYIIEKHGGQISLKSERAKGTEVIFTIRKS